MRPVINSLCHAPLPLSPPLSQVLRSDRDAAEDAAFYAAAAAAGGKKGAASGGKQKQPSSAAGAAGPVYRPRSKFAFYVAAAWGRIGSSNPGRQLLEFRSAEEGASRGQTRGRRCGAALVRLWHARSIRRAEAVCAAWYNLLLSCRCSRESISALLGLASSPLPLPTSPPRPSALPPACSDRALPRHLQRQDGRAHLHRPGARARLRQEGPTIRGQRQLQRRCSVDDRALRGLFADPGSAALCRWRGQRGGTRRQLVCRQARCRRCCWRVSGRGRCSLSCGSARSSRACRLRLPEQRQRQRQRQRSCRRQPQAPRQRRR